MITISKLRKYQDFLDIIKKLLSKDTIKRIKEPSHGVDENIFNTSNLLFVSRNVKNPYKWIRRHAIQCKNQRSWTGIHKRGYQMSTEYMKKSSILSVTQEMLMKATLR